MNEVLFLLVAVAISAERYDPSCRRLAMCAVGLGTMLLYSLAFRSRMIDLLGVALAAYCVSTVVARGRWPLTRKVLVRGGVLVGLALAGVVALTGIRGNLDAASAAAETIDRTFLLNQRVNLRRVEVYESIFGQSSGSTYLQDVRAPFDATQMSSQQEVTAFFNSRNSRLFTMTPTVYGEAFLNFGHLAPLAVGPVLIAFRYLFECLLLIVVSRASPTVAVAGIATLSFYVPRVVATGGIANAYMIKGVSVIIALMMIEAACRAQSQVIRARRREVGPWTHQLSGF